MHTKKRHVNNDKSWVLGYQPEVDVSLASTSNSENSNKSKIWQKIHK